MIALGIFSEQERFELLHGDLVLVPPQGPIHAGLLERLDAALRLVYPLHRIRVGMPIVASPESEPEPDVAITRGPQELRHPLCSEAILVVEVAQTSLQLDRAKAAIYAQAGVPEYWIVNLHARQLEQYTAPQPDGYQTCRWLDEAQTVTLPGTQTVWSVARLLP